MYIGDSLISVAICLWLPHNIPLCIFPNFCWIVATESVVQESYLAGQPTVWKIIKCLCSWLFIFLGWRRSVPCFSDHKRRNVFYQRKDWPFRVRPPSIRLCVFVCCSVVGLLLVICFSCPLCELFQGQQLPRALLSWLPQSTQMSDVSELFPRKLWLLIKSNNPAPLMVHLLRIWEQPHVSWRVMSSNLEGIE